MESDYETGEESVPVVSWERCAIYLSRHGKGTASWLPLLRDGRLTHKFKRVSLNREGKLVPATPTHETVTLELSAPVALESFTRDVWMRTIEDLRQRYVPMRRNGAPDARSTLRRLPEGSEIAYDSAKGFVLSIGKNVERYLQAEKAGWDPDSEFPTNDEDATTTPMALPAPDDGTSGTSGALVVADDDANAAPVSPTKRRKQSDADDHPKFAWPQTRGDRLESSCGQIPELVAYAKRYALKGGISTVQVNRWFKKNPQFLPKWLHGQVVECDHVIPDALGGHPWVYNYFLMPSAANRHFLNWATAEKAEYVGAAAWKQAQDFAKWARNASRARIDYAKFDPITDAFLGRA